MNNEFLAKSDLSSDAYTPGQLLAGSADLVTGPGTLASGQNLAELTVVGRIAASGLLTIWNPAASDGSQIAVGILMHSINASAGNRACEIYLGGTFNVDALVWPGGTTDAQKLRAFDASNINVRKVG